MSIGIVQILAFVYGIPFILIGIEHFREPQKFIEIVPSYLPFPLFLVYITGIMEIVGGIGIIYPDSRVLAGRFLVLFLIVVYLGNLYMWMNNVPFNGTKLTSTGHLIRLIIQILLIIGALGFSGDLSKIKNFGK